MPNQYVNKVVFGDQTLLDLTSDTVTADVLMEGYTAHDRSGAVITGTATGGGTGAISVVDTEDTHGGTIRTITAVDISDTTAVAGDVAQGKYFYTADGTKTAGTSTGGGGDNWSWMGKNPTKVATPLSEKVYLKDTGYATWTPTTTNTTIVTGENLNGYTANLDDYDYVVQWKFHTHFEYDGTEQNQYVTDYYFAYNNIAFGYPNAMLQMTNDENNGYTTGSIQMRYGLFYKNSLGVDIYTSMSQYGVFIYSSPSLGINTGTKVITPKSLTINARCGNGYFSTASASAVDQNASYYEQVVEIWRIDLRTSPNGGETKTVRDMWLAGDII